MKFRKIGKTRLEASVVTLGAMGIGGGFRFPDADDDVSIEAIHAALDRGINVIDTAPVYGFGHSEEVIGKAIRGRRDKVILSTKCGLWWGDDEGSYRFTWDSHAVKRNLSPRTIRIEIEDSLRRLQTDHIDIYYTHNPACPPFLTPIEDTIATLLALRDQGKILAIGASNCTMEDIGHYVAAGAIEIVQLKYNLLERGVEKDVLPLCEANGLTLHAYSPLAAGLLTGRFAPGHTLTSTEPRAANPLWTADVYPLALEFVDGLKKIAQARGTSTTALSIAYLLAVSPAVNVICGIGKPSHVDAIVAGADFALSDEDMTSVRALAQTFEERRAALKKT
ncbi:MAG: aldo/keto reductase [Burkholderiales bacterium]